MTSLNTPASKERISPKPKVNKTSGSTVNGKIRNVQPGVIPYMMNNRVINESRTKKSTTDCPIEAITRLIFGKLIFTTIEPAPIMLFEQTESPVENIP